MQSTLSLSTDRYNLIPNICALSKTSHCMINHSSIPFGKHLWSALSTMSTRCAPFCPWHATLLHHRHCEDKKVKTLCIVNPFPRSFSLLRLAFTVALFLPLLRQLGWIMDPAYPLVPTANLIACALVVFPLFHMVNRSWNTGVFILALWLLLINLTNGINTIIWSNDAKDKAPVWCDICTYPTKHNSIISI